MNPNENFAELYKRMGIKMGATQDEVKTAYRQLARQCHPDLNPTNGEKFKALSLAYSTLSDPDRRAQYDAKQARALYDHSQVLVAAIRLKPVAVKPQLNDAFMKLTALFMVWLWVSGGVQLVAKIGGGEWVRCIVALLWLVVWWFAFKRRNDDEDQRSDVQTTMDV